MEHGFETEFGLATGTKFPLHLHTNVNPLFWRTLPIVLALSSGNLEARAISTNLLPVADTYMRDSGSETSNFGSATAMLVGVSANGAPRNRGLIRFSLTDIPTNATMTGATLRLVSTAGQRPALAHGLHRLLKNWNEAEATWNNRLTATAWGAPGAQADDDYLAAPSATAPIDMPPATNFFSSAGMTADLQLWLSDSATNFGWIIIAVGNQLGSGKQVGSRENLDTNLWPVLTVDYTLPSPPEPLLIESPALIGDQFVFSFNGKSNQTYAVEFRDSLSSGDWSPLTNVPALSADMAVTVSSTNSADQRFFRVRTP